MSESRQTTIGVKVQSHRTDVLVIGGGIAGCLAALGARKSGSEVIIAEKYRVHSSGDSGCGTDHFLAILGEAPWDNSTEFYASKGYVSTMGALERPKRNKIYSDELPKVAHLLEEIGVPFRDKATNKYYRIKSLGRPQAYTIQYDGSQIKKILASYVVNQGVSAINHVMITRLVARDNSVLGAVGFDIKDGTIHTFSAKSVILSTGATARLYSSSSGNGFDSWLSPFNTGDGTAMAYHAGVELSDMEFLTGTMIVKGYSTPGQNAYAGAGCKYVNSKGEEFMQNYHPLAERCPRAYLVWGIYSEIKKGNGPVYLDARHLTDEEKDRLIETLFVDKGPLIDFFKQKNIDLRNELVEVSISELGSQSGIYVDEKGKSNMEGLFAAGSCDGIMSVSRASVEGYIAGREASDHASRAKAMELPDVRVEDEKSFLDSHLSSAPGIRYTELESKVREIMTKYVGFERTEASMKKALTLLDELESTMFPKMKAIDYHELTRLMEAINLHTVARLITIASLARKETRLGGNLLAPRADYPTEDQSLSEMTVVLSRGTSDKDVRAEIRKEKTI